MYTCLFWLTTVFFYLPWTWISVAIDKDKPWNTKKIKCWGSLCCNKRLTKMAHLPKTFALALTLTIWGFPQYFLRLPSVKIFSCEDAAQQKVPESFRKFQNGPERMQNVHECIQNALRMHSKCIQNVPECMQKVPECYRMHAEIYGMFQNACRMLWNVPECMQNIQ